MNIRKIQLQYYAGQKLYSISASSFINAKDFNVSLVPSYIDERGGRILEVKLLSKCDILMESFSIELDIRTENKKIMVNGYQSWTESGEMSGSSRLPGLNALVRPILSPYGDYQFHKYSSRKGVLHSYTYTYIFEDSSASSCSFLGSTDEASGYTVFSADMNRNSITVVKDCKGLEISKENIVLKLYCAYGDERDIWKQYLSYYQRGRKPLPECTGWTSWYNYYTSITEDIIIDNLHSLKENNIPLNVFQIDDGYQNALGDWLSINSKFPSGMKHIADEVKKCGYKPGLWLAPFICEKKSGLYKSHPDWVLKDSRGKPVSAGWNPNWSGNFYALDFYNPEFREYIKHVFDTVFNEWGFEMVKLDFLYGAALLPGNGKTRAGIMIEAMQFLSDAAGDRWVLGCGVPLAPAFGKVDYCRIGADVAPYWEDSKLKALHYRERVSTAASLRNTISRYWLNSKVFLNDPDVFIIREENNGLNTNQKHTLFMLNNLLGGLVFLSDDIGKYSEKEMGLFKSMFPKTSPNIKYIRRDGDTYRICFNVGEREYAVLSNLTDKEQGIKLPDGIYFNNEQKLLHGNITVKLMPFETKCYWKIEKNSFYPVVGTTGHVFPGCEIENITLKGDNLEIRFRDGFINENIIYFDKNTPYKYVTIKGNRYDIKEVSGYRTIEFKSDRP